MTFVWQDLKKPAALWDLFQKCQKLGTCCQTKANLLGVNIAALPSSFKGSKELKLIRKSSWIALTQFSLGLWRSFFIFRNSLFIFYFEKIKKFEYSLNLSSKSFQIGDFLEKTLFLKFKKPLWNGKFLVCSFFLKIFSLFQKLNQPE